MPGFEIKTKVRSPAEMTKKEEKDGGDKAKLVCTGNRRPRAACPTMFGAGASETESSNPFRVVSYNILAQSKVKRPCFPYCNAGQLKWNQRREAILTEVLSFDADILCLQEVDNFDIWWQPRLMGFGYDGVYYERNGTDYKDGVAIFFRRHLFQLFSSKKIDFDAAGEFLREGRERCNLLQHNIGVMVALQPWEDSTHPSALCITNVQLVKPFDHDNSLNEDLEEVQYKQCLMMLRSIEEFNSDFHLPVLLCGSFNFFPDSKHYRLFMDGCLPKKLYPPQAPKAAPSVRAISRYQVELSWKGEPACGDTPIKGWMVKRIAGGNGAGGYTDAKFYPGKDRRTAVATGLCSDMAYEFVFAAVSDIGVGEFSEPSKPVRTWADPENLNEFHHLQQDPALMIDKTQVQDWEGVQFDDEVFLKIGGTNTTPRFEDKTPNLLQSPVKTRLGRTGGTRLPNHRHTLCLSSAYTQHRNGEPKATQITETFKGCVDYIFFSRENLIAKELLELPDLARMQAVDHRRRREVEDAYDLQVARARSEAKDSDGEWNPRKVLNDRLYHSWLPNKDLASDHVALWCEFEYAVKNLSATWD